MLGEYLVNTMMSANTRIQTTATETGATIDNVSTRSLEASATSTCDDVISSRAAAGPAGISSASENGEENCLCT